MQKKERDFGGVSAEKKKGERKTKRRHQGRGRTGGGRTLKNFLAKRDIQREEEVLGERVRGIKKFLHIPDRKKESRLREDLHHRLQKRGLLILGHWCRETTLIQDQDLDLKWHAAHAKRCIVVHLHTLPIESSIARSRFLVSHNGSTGSVYERHAAHAILKFRKGVAKV
ncbi:hypothetical protein VNO77_14371 [Canavalia gladiata]|uniref:Uncharacterized protein n=1 Tax=Canavalia gladiata TaxID=3824 RepID=A0AAN9LY54_CANGL